MENNDTQIALLKQAMEFQNKEIIEIKKILLDFIDSADKKFATKEEHRQNKEEIEAIKGTQSKVQMALLWTFWTLFLAAIWLILKKIWII